MLKPFQAKYPDIVDPLLDKVKRFGGHGFVDLLMNSSDIGGQSCQDILRKTSNTQPAILATSYIIFSILADIARREGGSRLADVDIRRYMNYFLGHSLGEFTAMTVAGAWSFENGLHTVRKRGLMMEKEMRRIQLTKEISDPTAMYALTIDKKLSSKILSLLEKIAQQSVGKVNIANINSDSQVVLSGYEASIIKAIEGLPHSYGEVAFANDLKDLGIKSRKRAYRATKLDVELPFHSSFFAKLEPEMRSIITDPEHQFTWPAQFDASIVWNKTATDKYPDSVTQPGLPLHISNEAKRGYAISQLSSSCEHTVNWLGSVKYLLGQGVNLFLGVGPGKVLESIINTQIPAEKKSCISVLNFHDPTDFNSSKMETLFKSLYEMKKVY
ncbi:FabD/lysophospholipase-like protein [Nadsonia fulvescens var. elongata DSM 6958]|uniref:[acyl-carrier-protein] S-malonyltransferase n=1 Tax=Nadsonia fulvescens var. elongata DSM 6958 TaxID=857566 RepID=A0A1E3PKS1_9ASCO|nr:FabD/lysophospholipase-like protein [Nadsonia fulvescens var. elongata DSM 6958]